MENIENFINKIEIKQVLNKYHNLKESTFSIANFNLFMLISDIYYRENLHSDILKAFLEVPEIRSNFIIILNKLNPTLNILEIDYINSVIIREEGKIDLWIKNVSSINKKSILIENKINNAVDMQRQIPRYVEHVEKNNYEIDAIVYFTIDGYKQPDKSDWTQEEKVKIENKMINMSAYNNSDLDFYTILNKCDTLISDIDILFTSRQYKQLLKLLSINAMNKPVNDDFYKIAIENNNFEDIKAIAHLYSELPKIRAQRVRNQFSKNHLPFEKVDIWKDTVVFFDNLKTDNYSNFAIDIKCEVNSYHVDFFDRNANDNDSKSIENFIANLKITKYFSVIENNRRIYKVFKFPQEENELYKFIDEVLNLLNQEIVRIKSL